MDNAYFFVCSSFGRFVESKIACFHDTARNIFYCVRTLMIQQAYGGVFEQMLATTLNWHRRYAARHDITFWPVFGKVVFDQVDYWSKIPLIRSALNLDYELVVWLDADTIIVRADQDIRSALGNGGPPLGMCRHAIGWANLPWHYNAGVVFVRNTLEAKKFFDLVWDERYHANHYWPEQGCMNDILIQHPEWVQPLQDRWNCADSPEDYPGAVICAWHGSNREDALKELQRRVSLVDAADANDHVHPMQKMVFQKQAVELRSRYRNDQKCLIEQTMAAELMSRTYLYQRSGCGEREMSFTDDGMVERGAQGCEVYWNIRGTDDQNVVLEISSATELTCRLRPEPGGGWHGRWLRAEQNPVALLPL